MIPFFFKASLFCKDAVVKEKNRLNRKLVKIDPFFRTMLVDYTAAL